MTTLKRNAQGIRLTCYTDGSRPVFYISKEDETVDREEVRLFGREQLEGLKYCVDSLLRATDTL